MKLFQNQTAVLVTKHAKERVIRPIFEQKTGCAVIVEHGYDTDLLGTFSREVDRRNSQLKTARTKIDEGMKLVNANLGIASEGSFMEYYGLPIPWNIELVLLYDKQEDRETYGIYESAETNLHHQTVRSLEEVMQFANRIGFPEHYIVMRPDHERSSQIIKDINTYEKLEDSFKWCEKHSIVGTVFIETDMRAHANPTRMDNIEKATLNLIEKLHTFCPACGAPGFIIQEVIRGLPCEKCGTPSELALRYVSRCYKCKHTQEQYYPKGHSAPPKYCNRCNP